MRGINCWGKPGTKDPTEADAPAVAEEELVAWGLAEGLEGEADVGAEDAGAGTSDGALEVGIPPHAERLNATPTATNAKVAG
ncbi:hypothetical protein [Arthrobacter sp. NyZ413]|uniref:hypothetical protein n=1 Tax=Arthrobacter sp. NyZ413 TaxID=3144669 RepID=UPI002B9740D5|nr:hypothetical protein [Arthrobacter sp.]